LSINDREDNCPVGKCRTPLPPVRPAAIEVKVSSIDAGLPDCAETDPLTTSSAVAAANINDTFFAFISILIFTDITGKLQSHGNEMRSMVAYRGAQSPVQSAIRSCGILAISRHFIPALREGRSGGQARVPQRDLVEQDSSIASSADDGGGGRWQRLH